MFGRWGKALLAFILGVRLLEPFSASEVPSIFHSGLCSSVMGNINDWKEIPLLEEEIDEANYWLTHQLSPKSMNSSIHQPDSRESTTITLRFDPRMLARIKRIARSRFLNYQSMMKQWLSERLEEEIKKS